MAAQLRIKRSAIPGRIPEIGSLDLGEIALNTYDGKLYIKKTQGAISTIVDIGAAEVTDVLYVASSGNDLNNGKSLNAPFRSIKAALAVATPGTTVFVKAGDYTEDNPVTIPARVAVVGDSLRTVSVRPAIPSSAIFYVNNGCYVTQITFRDHANGAPAFAFNPDSSAGTITTSPYIQNCSSITTTGTGMYIDGSKVGGQKSMVLDSYTQFNSGGIGIHIDNGGYAQLVSIFTICCEIGILCENGASCSITNSNSSFGTYGLKASGTSPILYLGTTSGVDQTGKTISIAGLTQRPYVNQAVSFDEGSTFYTIDSATELVTTTSIVTLLEDVVNPIPDNTPARFYQQSLISASGHTFEYVGSGINLVTALPQAGGIPIQANEVIEENGGKIFFTSTDQKGDFRIGGDLLISRSTGTITGTTFDKSLFAVLTPYILAIEG